MNMKIKYIPLMLLGSFILPVIASPKTLVKKESWRKSKQLSSKVIDPLFWISQAKGANTILIADKEIAGINEGIRKQFPGIIDIMAVKKPYTSQVIDGLITKYKIPKYGNCRNRAGKIWKKSRLQKLGKLRDGKKYKKLTYGLVVERSNLRSFPTPYWCIDKTFNPLFDLFQETALSMNDAVIILAEDITQKWFFVKSHFYSGWMLKDSIALVDKKEELNKWVNPKNFLMVAKSFVKMGDIHVMMGTKIPIWRTVVYAFGGGYRLHLPIRDKDGKLKPKRFRIFDISSFNKGYLVLTKANIIKQSYRMLGDKYSWGGSIKGRDCSRFTYDVFRSFGILLPRNSSQQRTVGKNVFKKSITSSKLQVGDLVFTKGHAMLYLGLKDKKQYFIHSKSKVHKASSVKEVLKVIISPSDVLKGGNKDIQWARRIIPKAKVKAKKNSKNNLNLSKSTESLS